MTLGLGDHFINILCTLLMTVVNKLAHFENSALFCACKWWYVAYFVSTVSYTCKIFIKLTTDWLKAHFFGYVLKA